MSECPFISSALGGRPTVPYPNAGTDQDKDMKTEIKR